MQTQNFNEALETALRTSLDGYIEAVMDSMEFSHGELTEEQQLTVDRHIHNLMALKPVGFLFVSNGGLVAYSPVSSPMHDFTLVGQVYGSVHPKGAENET